MTEADKDREKKIKILTGLTILKEMDKRQMKPVLN
jgi:hypothetical protein